MYESLGFAKALPKLGRTPGCWNLPGFGFAFFPLKLNRSFQPTIICISKHIGVYQEFNLYFGQNDTTKFDYLFNF